MKWEYLLEQVPLDRAQQYLDTAGKQGWELVSLTQPVAGHYVIAMKRPRK